jgi:hypothetical protein
MRGRRGQAPLRNWRYQGLPHHNPNTLIGRSNSATVRTSSARNIQFKLGIQLSPRPIAPLSCPEMLPNGVVHPIS